LLSAGGRLLISIPNLAYAGLVAELLRGDFRYRPQGLLDRTHLRFFTRGSLLGLLREHGFGATSLRSVIQEPRQSEFDPTALDSLLPQVQQAILDAPDALAYQFIVEAVPGEGAPLLRAVTPAPRLRFACQVFWAGEGQSFDESRSSVATGLIGESDQRIEIAVPAMSPPPARLRLDVSDRTGYVRMHALRVENQAGEVLWAWDGAPSSLRSHDLLAFQGPLGSTWLATSADPHLELPVSSGDLQRLGAGGRVVLQMGWPGSADHAIAAAVLDEASRRADAERGVLLQRLDRAEAALKQMVDRQGTVLHRTESLAQRVLTLEMGSLRRTLRSIRSTVMRRRFTFELLPSPKLRRVEGSTEEWEATGPDPYFDLASDQGRFPIGWVQIDLEFDCDPTPASGPLLYIDGGQGYSEASCVRLPKPVNGRVHALLQMPPQVRGMRFDPVERSARFRLAALQMQEIGKAEVAARVLAPAARELLRDPGRLPKLAAKALRILRSDGLAGMKQRLIQAARGEERQKSYTEWVQRFDTLDEADRAAIAERLRILPYQPLLSVVMPTYETPDKWLRRAVATVQAQLYSNWELCIADDASRSAHVRNTLEELARSDSRIRVVFRERNGHISEASNSALELVRGEFVVLLDHDDELPAHALYRVVEELNAHRDSAIIYGDEDKIDDRSERFDPYFKPDWNPDLFYSHNMISHLGVYRTSLVREVGGFRKSLEGSQDYDLALRVIERIRPEQIRHIPAVLYHWRAIRGSTAYSADQKSYAHVASRRAIQEHLDRGGVDATVVPGPVEGLHRVRYRLPDPPLVSIIIPTRDGLKLLERCIGGIRQRTDYPNWELLVVDNQSSDPATLRYLERLSTGGIARILRYPAAFNYSAINNVAAREAKGTVLAFLNDDLDVISPGWLQEMVSHAVRPAVGVVGAKLLYPDDTVQHAGIFLGLGADGIAGTPHRGLPRSHYGHFGRAAVLQDFSAVTAACMVMRRDVFEAVGGFDEQHLPVSYNDIDLCLRVIETGRRVLWTPHAELYHHESATRGSDLKPEHRERFLREAEYMRRRWGEKLRADPFYNPNLSLDSDRFDLAMPPRRPAPWER
jgi:glycosyltransferase involved in cell wall biosynthesis